MKPSKHINKEKTNIFIIAGEESGDIHGSHLVTELSKLNPNLKFIGHGGDKMKAAGVDIIEHISKLSLVGFTEVIKHLPYMFSVMKKTVNKIIDVNPERIVLIDYPGFNLRLAEKVKSLNIPITYFILPQVWAWKENRVQKLKDFTDQAISIIPFEKDWFNKKGLSIDYVGHPFTEMKKPSITKGIFYKNHSLDLKNPLLVLLPGSRQQEIDRHWAIFLETINSLHKTFPNLQFVIGKAPNVSIEDIPSFVKIEKDSKIVLAYGDAGLVASGTVTLEAAVLGLPIVVCYKSSAITHFVGKILAKVKYLSLPNLIADDKIVPELIQNDMNQKSLIKAIVPLLSDTPEKGKMMSAYKKISAILGKPGVYNRVAKLIVDKIN